MKVLAIGTPSQHIPLYLYTTEVGKSLLGVSTMLQWRQTMVLRPWTDFSSMHNYLPKQRRMTLSQANITQMNPNYGKFEVKTNKGKQKVDFGGESNELMCSCKDWLAYHLPCKHLFVTRQPIYCQLYKFRTKHSWWYKSWFGTKPLSKHLDEIPRKVHSTTCRFSRRSMNLLLVYHVFDGLLMWIKH